MVDLPDDMVFHETDAERRTRIALARVVARQEETGEQLVTEEPAMYRLTNAGINALLDELERERNPMRASLRKDGR